MKHSIIRRGSIALLALALPACASGPKAEHAEAQASPRPTVAAAEGRGTAAEVGFACSAIRPSLEGADFIGSSPEAWPGAWYSAEGDLIGWAATEDGPIYTSAECAKAELLDIYGANDGSLEEVCSQGPFEGMDEMIPTLCEALEAAQ